MIIKLPTAKTILKSVLYFCTILILIFAAWVGYIKFHGDEKPDAGRDAFYAITEKPVPDNQNVAVAISGITAPADTDVFEHGRFVLNTYKNAEDNDAAEKIIAQKNSLAFVGKAEELLCWLYDENKQKQSNEPCADEARIRTLLADNKIQRERYLDLYKLPYFQGLSKNNLLAIQLNDLLQAEVRLDANHVQFDSAFEKWQKNHTFINQILEQESNLLNRSTALALLGSSLKTLEYLLFKKPDIASMHYQELLSLLIPINLNLEATLRLESITKYDLLKVAPVESQADPNYLKNRAYRADMDLLAEARKSPFNYELSQNALLEKGWGGGISYFAINWLNPFNSLLSKYGSRDIYNKLHLIEKIHIKNSMIKLLNLSIQIKQQHVAESQIQTLLNNAGAEYNNPFTNKPMQYDDQKKVIYCVQPWSGDKTEVRL